MARCPNSTVSFCHALCVRFTAEIVQDLQSTYEMPADAVAWVKDMILYTVDGGKMNRGLATVDVIRTLAARDGRSLSNKVRS